MAPSSHCSAPIVICRNLSVSHRSTCPDYPSDGYPRLQRNTSLHEPATSRVLGYLGDSKLVTAALSNTVLVALMSASAFGQSAAVGSPKFEVAAIKLCRDGENLAGAAKGGSPLGTSGLPSAGRLHFNCATVAGLIQQAYVTYANGVVSRGPVCRSMEVHPGSIPIVMISTRKPKIMQPQASLQGPMLRALLEDRFKLKIRREVREVSVYVLNVAKSGPKLRQFKEGTCTPIDLTRPPSPPRAGPKARLHQHDLGISKGSEHGESVHPGGYYR